MTTEPRATELIERIRVLLSGQQSTREVSMFGGRSFMINDKMIVSARNGGDLLVRVPADQHDTLLTRGGAAQAEMGAGREMGPGWIAVTAASITSDADLSFWLGVALDYNRAVTRRRR